MSDPHGLQMHQYQEEINDDEDQHDWPSGGESDGPDDDE